MPPLVDISMEETSDTWLSVSGWLENQAKGFVIYVGLGNELTLNQETLTKLALGLEISSLPFFWALRNPSNSKESNSVELPNGHPLIMLPIMVEQGLNARIFEKNKVGIEISRDDRDGLLYQNSVAESLKLVITDDEGKVYRDKARQMRAIFGDKLRHDHYIDKFIEHLQNCRSLHMD
ncbi:hypothetical protein ACSBR1_024904 [Camellia fascicularis]